MMRYHLLTISVAGSFLASCAGRPATTRSIELATPAMRHEGRVAIYPELCDIPAPMRVIAPVEVANGDRERAAIERDLADKAARAGANAIVLDPLNRWALGATYTDAKPIGFDPFRSSRATAILVLSGETITSGPAGYKTGSLTCGAR